MPQKSEISPPARSAVGWRNWCASHPVICFAIVAACLVLLLYRNVLSGAFVYDDYDQIQTNSNLTSWNSVFAHYVAAAQPFSGEFRGAGGSSYRPVFWLSLALDRHLFDLNVSGFHTINLLLHWANGLSVFVLLRGLKLSLRKATATALIWLALPINCEAVAWISGRAYCLLALFFLLSLLSAEKYLQTQSRFALLCYGAFFAGALLSHEAGILVLPFVFLLSHSRLITARCSPRPLYVVGTALSVAYLCIRMLIAGSINTPHPFAFWPIGVTIVKYLGWMVLPFHMSVDRSTDTPPDVLSLSNVLGLCAVFLLAISAWFFRNKLPDLSAGMAWILVALLPFSGIVFLYQGMAERYDYLASLGLVLGVVSLASIPNGNLRHATLCVLAVWSLWGLRRLELRIDDWRSEVSLYASSLKTNPDSPALLLSLGSTLGDAGDFDKAFPLISRAISLRPNYETAYRALGNLYLRRGEFEQARNSYEKAVELQPADVPAITNLGNTDIALKKFAAGESELRRAISLAPKDVTARCDLGIALFNEGKSDESIQELLKAASIAPSDPTPYYLAGFVDEQLGIPQAAEQMYQKAIQLNPSYSEARTRLNRLLGLE